MKKEMLINVLQPEECRIAIVEDGVLEELYVERTSLESYTGNIYKGKIVNLEPAIQAAFVDFSVGRNGFLHVSDVEPQYYDRHREFDAPAPTRDRDRDRDRGERDPRRRPPPRIEDRDPGGPPPRDRDRDRDRPDRSEKGRRDRSELRRFGEGLLGEEDLAPLPPPPPPLPPPPAPVSPAFTEAPEPSTVPVPPSAPAELTHRPSIEREEPRRAWPEPPVPRPSPWDVETSFGRPASAEREPEPGPSLGFEPPPPTLPPSPRARPSRSAETVDPDLPPSRTHRGRSQTPPPGPAAFADEEELGRPRFEAETGREPEPPPAPGRQREPRRGRGRGRTSKPVSEPESGYALEPDLDPEPLAPEPLEPEEETRPEPPRRRGGRQAIRSRPGDREPVPERPRERERPIPAEPAAESERERVRERPRAIESEPTRERERERERERARSHDRAGEPGYVPRRERSRGTEPTPTSAFGHGSVEWADLGPEPGLEAEPLGEADEESSTREGGRPDGPRRRRRRRGRRRERPGLESAAGVSPVDEFDDDLDEEEVGPPALAPPPPSSRRAEPPKPAARTPVEDEGLGHDFDFGDDEDVEPFDEDELIDDLQDRDRAVEVEDDEIDPGLEEEIRREVEEIAELEREMGLRGTTEARPRRGDDRDVEPGGRAPRGRGPYKPPLQEIFRRGDEVLVQVIKESIGTKGPTLSTYISIPGRYLVLMPGLNRVGVSRKIADEGQRRKLREIMNELNPPKGLGFIVRTAGLERTKRELARDLAYLLRLWKVILRRIKKARTPAPIYQESDMITRTIRDIFTAEIDTIWIDEPAAFERAREFLQVVMPKFVNRLKLYEERVPLFHKYGIEDEIAKIQRRHVPLPQGGSIVIDQTEALVAIDVNSGNFRVENDAERTAYEMNLRAAKEIARQLRLRDLGGVIVNDFIDMREERHRRGVEKAMRDAIKRDRARTKVLRMSAFGLIEMTRQRIRPSLKRSVYEDCSHCAGAGVVKTVESMSIDVMRLLALASHREDIRRVNVSVSPAVATYLNNRKRGDLTRLEHDYNMTILIRPEENMPAEHLQMDCFDGNNGEIRLLPAPAPAHRRPH